MKYISVGDMSQTYLMRRHNAQLKTTMTRLSEEMVTGVSQDVGAAVGGDFTAISAIEHALSRTGAFKLAATEAELIAGAQQQTLNLFQNHAHEIGSNLISAASSSASAMVEAGMSDAAQRFSSILAALNTNISGRHVFAGVATDSIPVAPEATIMAALGASVSGMTLVEDIVTAVDDWFDAPAGGGGYLDVAYLGSDTALAGFAVADTDTVELPLTAADPTLRDALKGFALAALVAQDLVPDTHDLRVSLAQTAGEKIISAEGNLTALQSELGTTEGIISSAQTRNAAQKTSLQIAKGELIGVDAYESATALEAVQTQLDTLYTLTTRLSQLSLTDYL